MEPLWERWREWPDHPQLIALPVAIADERGQLEFNVTADDAASSLLRSTEGHTLDEVIRTVDIREVPVIRLEDVLERIPAGVEIEFVKTDVQGLDLEVLRSGGEQLRRVTFVKTEVILNDAYVPEGERRPGTEDEFVSYMESGVPIRRRVRRRARPGLGRLRLRQPPRWSLGQDAALDAISPLGDPDGSAD